MPKISIIVPIYNTEEYLERCLDSLVGQTMKEIEILLINDGSPDNSQAVIDRYLAAYPQRIRAFSQENNGQGSARNLGLRNATGEFVFFVDSDDYLEIDACEKAYRYAAENALDVVCFGLIRDQGQEQVPMALGMIPHEDLQIRYLLNEASPCNKIVRARLFFENSLRFTEQRIYEDLELIPQLALYTDRIGYMADGLYHYVIHEGSTMRQKCYNEKLRDIFPVMDTLKQKLYGTQFRTELEFLYIEHLLHAAVLRFLPYEQGKTDLAQIARVMKSTFPRWKRNPYYKTRSWKYKLVCELASRRAWGLLRKLLGVAK